MSDNYNLSEAERASLMSQRYNSEDFEIMARYAPPIACNTARHLARLEVQANRYTMDEKDGQNIVCKHLVRIASSDDLSRKFWK